MACGVGAPTFPWRSELKSSNALPTELASWQSIKKIFSVCSWINLRIQNPQTWKNGYIYLVIKITNLNMFAYFLPSPNTL